jgi:hypothetical protein
MVAGASSALPRPATGPATPSPAAGLRADPRRRPRLPVFVFAEYLAIAHLEADALVTVDLELAANAEKVTRVASIQDLVASE